MSDLFMQAFGAVSGAEWEEVPVGVEEFVKSEEYLGLPPLSEYQHQMVRAGTQIYKLETLVALYGEEAGRKRYSETTEECIFCLGKGSGKDFISTVICAYTVYLLLCLKDPQKYYGKPAENSIDILNVATNSDQAKNVFFKNLKTIIKNCPWFDGKYDPPTQNSISFDKSINLYSGHSEREAFEGLNLFLAVLDEISAFADTETESPEDTYNTYRDSVDSRFPGGIGKVLLLSFPRKLENDFILDKYNEVIAEKEVVVRKKTLKLDPDLPEGTEGNEFDVEWEEDHIVRYKYPRVFALKRPSWEVNPTKDIQMYARNFYTNMPNALAKFAAMPQRGGDSGFFTNHDAIDAALTHTNGVDGNGVFYDNFKPKPGVKYYIHVDLAQVHDKAAVAMAHVDSWVNVSMGSNYTELHPVVVVDSLRWWKPDRSLGIEVEFSDVRDYIIGLRRRGFDISLTTFDRWSSLESRNILEREHGIKTEVLSVGTTHYEDFRSCLYDNRLVLPAEKELGGELKELYLDKKGRVEHPASGGKDLSDATCGAIFNAVSRTIKPVNMTVEVKTFKELMKEQEEQRQSAQFDGVIRPPKAQPTGEIAEYLSRLRTL